MKLFGRITVSVIFFGCLAALIMSIWPGWLNDLMGDVVLIGFLLAPVVLLVLGVCIYLLRHLSDSITKNFPWKHLAMGALMLIVTLAALRFSIPRRVVFASYRSSFQKLIDDGVEDNRQFNHRIGPYRLVECLTDVRGGTYFLVYSGADGISPDVMSYGFCYQPNREGSPFGAARYRIYSLGRGWYWFRASDDWF